MVLKRGIDIMITDRNYTVIDIETTGLYARSSSLYLIGCIFLNQEITPNEWCSIQWLAQNYEDEVNVLNSFSKFAADFRYLIHFNGNQFDIHYLTQKYEQYKINFSFDINNFTFKSYETTCKRCPNRCEIISIKKDNKLIDSWGNRCEKGTLKV